MARHLPEPEGDEYVRVAASGLHGRGLFAARALAKGTRIIEYRGEKVPRAEGNARAQKQWRKGRIYVFRLNQRFDVDGAPRWNTARLANFSCDPNAESEIEDARRIWIVARRRIAAGEEITYDYHLDFEEPPAECNCGSPRCIGYMVSGEPEALAKLHDWLLREGLPVPPGLAARLRRRTASRN